MKPTVENNLECIQPPLSEDDRTSLVLTGHSNVSSETSKSHLTSELFVSYRSTLLSDISIRSTRESTSNELSQVYTQLNQLLDRGFSSKQPIQDGDKVIPRRGRGRGRALGEEYFQRKFLPGLTRQVVARASGGSKG